MVVTKEVSVKIEPHDESEVTLEVACLDIGLKAPGETNRSWTIGRSPALRQYIACVSRHVDERQRQEPNNPEFSEENRPGLIQGGLWKARRASREEWIAFFENYRNTTPEEARALADDVIPEVEELVKECPSLARE